MELASDPEFPLLGIYSWELKTYVHMTSFFFWWSLLLLPRIEFRGVILGPLNLYLQGPSDSPALVSRVAGITGMCYHTQVILYF